MADSKKRIALKPHIEQIREWVEEGKTDDWIADALGTSASSVQSFRSRNDIYRRERGRGEPASVFEAVLDHGERDGWGLWFDPAVADDPIWQEHWANVEAVVVKLAEDSIVLEMASRDAQPATDGSEAVVFGGGQPDADLSNGSGAAAVGAALQDGDGTPAHEPEGAPDATERERGRVKWFDPDKGYGFLIRPTGEDLFVHHSEIEGSASDLGPGGEVEYVVGRNDRGPNARSVRLLD
jgi:cold shock CspA family protein